MDAERWQHTPHRGSEVRIVVDKKTVEFASEIARTRIKDRGKDLSARRSSRVQILVPIPEQGTAARQIWHVGQ